MLSDLIKNFNKYDIIIVGCSYLELLLQKDYHFYKIKNFNCR